MEDTLGNESRSIKIPRALSMSSFLVKVFSDAVLEIVRDVPGTPIAPRAGESPSTWIGIDTTPPQATSLDVVTVKKSDSDAFEIHYSFEDPLAIPDRVRLSYSPHRSGPWATIASDQACQWSLQLEATSLFTKPRICAN